MTRLTDDAAKVTAITRCENRARELSDEADFIEISLSALNAVKDSEWSRYETDKNEASMFRWRLFMDQLDDARRRLAMTRADVEHYQQVRAHLAGKADA